MSAAARAGQVVLVVSGLLCILFSASTMFVTEDPFPEDANALIASFGVGMGVLVIVLATVGLAAGQRWAWLALWVVPAFFVSHVALLGTWVPDGVLAALSVAALAATRPATAEPSSARAAAISSGV